MRVLVIAIFSINFIFASSINTNTDNTQESKKINDTSQPKENVKQNNPQEDFTLQDEFFSKNKNSIKSFSKEKKVDSDFKNDILKKVFPNHYIESIFNGFFGGIQETLLKINIRRIAVDFSNNSINVSDKYRDLKINQFSGDNTTVANIVTDFALEYNFENSRLANSLFAEYGLIVLNPKYSETTKTETVDNLVFTTGYTRKLFIFDKGFLGPFIEGEYQTEFTRKDDGSRNQYLRYKAGIRFLDGKYIDEAYLSGVGELDLSYSPSSIKGALEAGLRAKTPINDDLKVVYQGFFRQYIGYSIFRESDLLYNFNLNIRLDVSIYKGFAFSPFISARFAKIRGANSGGNNITSGISLIYSNSINAISSIQNTQNDRLKEYYKSID